MTILEFKDIYKEYAPCEDGSKAFEDATTRKEVFHVMTHPSWYDFIMKSMVKGWGPSPSDIKAVFSSYVNGSYIEDHVVNGIPCATSVICDASGRHEVKRGVRLLLLCGVSGDVVVEDWETIKIVAGSGSDIRVVAGVNSLVYVETYGSRVESVSGGVRVKKKY